MPRIPVREQQVRRQAPSISTPNVRVDVPQDVFLSGFDRAAGDISRAFGKIADVLAHKEERDDKQKVLDISTQFNKDVQDLMLSPELINKTDANGQEIQLPKGLLNRELRQAKDASVDYETGIEQLKNKYMANVDDRLRPVLNNMFNQTYLGNRDNIIKHETNQYNKDKDISLSANLETLKQQAILNPTSQNVKDIIRRGRGDIYINNQGVYGKEKTDIDMQIYSNDVIAKAVDGLLGNINYEQARIVLEENKDLIGGEMYGKLDGKISAGRYIEIARNISNSGLTFEQQLKEVDKIAEPVLMNKVKDEVKTREQEKRSIDNQNKYAYEQDQWTRMFENPLKYNLRGQISKLDDGTYRALENYQKRFIEEMNGSGSGGKGIGWASWNNYMTMDIEDLKKVPVDKIVNDVMDTSKSTEVLKRRMDGLVGKDSAKRVRTDLAVAKDLMKEVENKGFLGFRTQKDIFKATKPPAKLKAKEIEKQNEFYIQFENAINDLDKKDRTEENLNKVGREIIYKMTTTEKEKIKVALNNRPVKLQRLNNLNYDTVADVYYLDNGNKRTIYDRNGNVLAEGAKR